MEDPPFQWNSRDSKAGNLLLTPEEYCKILGLGLRDVFYSIKLGRVMIFRKAPVPQIRTFLNVALPKDAKVVPVVPDGITDAEAPGSRGRPVNNKQRTGEMGRIS